MCGIIGILGNHEVGPLLVNALSVLNIEAMTAQGLPL